MAEQLVSGSEAVALGAARAGVMVAAASPDVPAAGCLATLCALPALPGRHFESSASAQVAFDLAAGAASVGQPALCALTTSGVRIAFDSLCSIARAGMPGALVIYVVDDPRAAPAMPGDDTRGLARICNLPVLEPATVAEACRLAELAFDISERAGAPVLVRVVDRIALSRGSVDVDRSLSQPDRSTRPAHEESSKTGPSGAMVHDGSALARLEAAGEIIRGLGLNHLYLAPRATRTAAFRGSVLPEPPAELSEAPSGAAGLAERLAGPHARELVARVQDALYPLLPLRESLPDPLQEALEQAEQRLRQAQEALHQAHELPLRQAEELLRYVDMALDQVAEALPHTVAALRSAQEVLRQLHDRLHANQEPGVVPPAEPARVLLPVSDPRSFAGIGIVASGVTAAYVDEGIACLSSLLPTGSPPLATEDISVLRLASGYPFPAVEVQALLRHCHTIVVLEELEPYLERDLYVEALRLEFDGQIIGKLNGFYNCLEPYGVREVVRGLAAALDITVPAGAVPGG